MGSWTNNYHLYLCAAGEQGWGDAINGNFETIDEKLKEQADTHTSHTQSHDTVDGKMQTSADIIVPTPYKIAGNLQGNVIGNVTGNLSGTVTGNLSGDVTGSINGWSFQAPSYISPQSTSAQSAVNDIGIGTRVIWDGYPISGYLPIRGSPPQGGNSATITASFYNKSGELLSSDSTNIAIDKNVIIPSGCYKIVITVTGNNSTAYYGAGDPTATLLPGIIARRPFA